jgi:surface protein
MGNCERLIQQNKQMNAALLNSLRGELSQPAAVDSVDMKKGVKDEERYEFVLNLYMIRKQYKRMGCFQPDFIWVVFNPMMVSKYQRSDGDIQKAVKDWCEGPVAATVKYGHINKWNTSLVTDMSKLFCMKRGFNEDISKWDVSNVTDMSYMFHRTSFDGDISKWNVSKVTSMNNIFSETPFSGDISNWDVSNVTSMKSMFERTFSFNGNISEWNVSNVSDMSHMFSSESVFNGDISTWNVSNVKDMTCMFLYAEFTGNISEWDVRDTVMNATYVGCPIPEEHKAKQ